MRGGTCNCTVVHLRPADRLADHPSAARALHRAEPALARQVRGPRCGPAGCIVVNTSLINRGSRGGPTSRSSRSPANEIANEVGNAKAANMVALGAFLGAIGARGPEERRGRARGRVPQQAEADRPQQGRAAARASRSARATPRPWPCAGKERAMAKKLMKGNEAIGEAAIQRRLPAVLRLPDHAPERDPRVHVRSACRRWAASSSRPRARSRRSTCSTAPPAPGARVFTSSSSPGISLMQEGISLHRRRRAAGGDRQHHARRPGPRRHPALAGGLLPGDQGRRPRRLPAARAGALDGAGGGGPRAWTPSTWPTSTATR